MIALNRKMPRNCMDSCPCLQTVMLKNKRGEEAIGRFCVAAGKIIYYCDVSDNPPDEWVNFKKPSWCPWIDMTEPSYDKEFEREWLQEKLNDLEDGDMFGY